MTVNNIPLREYIIAFGYKIFISAYYSRHGYYSC